LSSDHDVDVNQPVDEGSTPLIVSAYFGRSMCVERLLQHPSIDTTLQFQQHMALHWSQPEALYDAWNFLDEEIDAKGRKKVVQLLIDAGVQ